MPRSALLVGISARVDIGVDVEWCESSIVWWSRRGKRLVLTRKAAFFSERRASHQVRTA